MSFYNTCCRRLLAEHPDATTGSRLQCGYCQNSFTHDGEAWRNDLELGTRKIEKLTTIHKVNQFLLGQQ